MVVPFRVEGIDKCTADTMSILENAMKNGGSYKTILRCFQGIAYGIQNAHEPIPEHAVETDVVNRRENVAAQYFRLAQLSYEIDTLYKEIDKKKDQKRSLELKLEETQKALQDLIEAHPRAWYDLQEMSPNEADAATGETKEMAGLQKRAVDIQKSINQTKLLIGQRQQEVYSLESSCSSLFLQISNREPQIDDLSVAEILRLQKEFEKEMLQDQKRIKELNNAFDAFDKAISYILAGREEREWEIGVWREYQNMVKQLQQDQNRDEEGRIRYKQEQEERRLEEEKQKNQRQQDMIQKQSELNTQSGKNLYN